jgi:tetratricopeptide (TPR) repeat protein
MSMTRAVLLLSLFLWAATASAETASPSASASSSASAPDMPLPALQELAPIDDGPPKAEALESVDARLEELAGTVVKDPLAAPDLAFVVKDLDPDAVPAIAQRLRELKDELDGKDASDLLEKARNAGRKALRAKKQKAEDDDGDWLVFVLALAKDRDDPAWRGTVHLYGMLRMLEALQTTPAVRQMVASYAYFGELVRIDLQRAFGRIKDKAIPALLEAKKHDAQKVRSWARRQLDALGKAIPGEMVSTTDPDVLVDVLRAFGRIRDVDAAGVVLSYVGAERTELRQAAREAIVAIGEPGLWELREAYKVLVGDQAPKSWDWKRLAQELFRQHDRARLSNVYELFEAGIAAEKDGHHADATASFDKVLVRVPLFERRHEMAPAYLAHGRELLDRGELDSAAAALRKALMMTPSGSDTKPIESRLAYLEAQALEAKGAPDRLLLQRALELDPSNAQAKKLLASLDEQSSERQGRATRWLVAAAVVILALAALVLLWRRRGPKPPSTPVPASSK